MYKSEVAGKGGIQARVVADSVANDVRLTTLELCYPRFIHAEFMTHRMFSRNASSSRAIPVNKMIQQVEENPAMPIHWGKNQPGMQAKEECDNLLGGELTRESAWKEAALDSTTWASLFSQAGYHKQIVNRLLEPFQFIHVVVTATEWDNFFKLRLHEDAQPEIHELARCMKGAMDNSTTLYLAPGEYHLPYVEDYDLSTRDGPWGETAIKASVARCARVSYKNHDNTNPDIKKDVQLHDMLLENGHMSPFEHQATPMDEIGIEPDGDYTHNPLSGLKEEGITHVDVDGYFWSGNFHGWAQYRQMLQE